MKILGIVLESLNIGDIACIEIGEDTTVKKADQQDYKEVEYPYEPESIKEK